MGRSSVFSLEQIYRKQVVGTWSKIPEVFRYVNSVAPAAGPAFGYFAGGKASGPLRSTVDRVDYSSDSFYTNFEAVQKTNNPILVFGIPSETFIKKGSGFLINAGFFKERLGFDFTFRRLENMSFYSEIKSAGNEYNESILNYLPALTKQHDYSLTNLYVYAAQPDVNFYVENLMKSGEIGFQTDFYYLIKKDSFLGGKYDYKKY